MKQSPFSANIGIAEPCNLDHITCLYEPEKGFINPVFTTVALQLEILSCYFTVN